MEAATALSESDLIRIPVSAYDRALTKKRHARDPVGFVTEKLHEFVWSKQVEILNAVRDHRKVAVQACHAPGKSFVSARAAAWWLSTNKVGDAFVVTSAPTFPQVRAILWREIGRAFSHGKLGGRLNQIEWFMTAQDGHEELVAFGRKPADMDPSAFQGIHAIKVLVIFDESGGIPAPLWEAAESLISNEESHFLAIGNPDDPSSVFAQKCKPGSGWHVIKISAFDSPNFTGEPVPDRVARSLVGPSYVADKRRLGESSPIYISKVLGEFPETSDDGLIRIGWVSAAQDRELEPTGPNELGVDVAGEGRDQSCLALRRGRVVRVLECFHEPDTMVTVGRIVRVIVAHKVTTVRVDVIGIGHGVYNRLDEMSRDHESSIYGVKIEGVNVAVSANDKERFANLKAELSWGMRERFESGDIDIAPKQGKDQDDDLAHEITAIEYTTNSRGQILIKPKEEARLLLGRSPDRWDAVVLCCATGASSATGMPPTFEAPSRWSFGSGAARNPALGDF
jgi:hypothetical protein